MTLLQNENVQASIDLFSAWTEAQMAYRGQPGVSVAVVYDQEIVWSHGFGWAAMQNKVAATPQTIYRIASITKLFTATAVLQCRDAGKLQLDDPVVKHLPWFEVQNEFEDAPTITIRHLLTHTSGLPREANFPYWTDSNFPTLAQIQETLPNQQTAVPTETRWKYSNLAVSLLGAIVAQCTGQKYEDYVKLNILQPLGMNSTFVETIPENHERLAIGYGRRLPDNSPREMMPFTTCNGITPAANMATTVEDLAQFVMLQFRAGDGKESNTAGGKQLLKGSTLREMHRVHWLDPSWQNGWGLGFSINRIKGKTYIGHGGAVLGYRTLVRMHIESKIGVIVFTNADDGDPFIYVDKAFDWIGKAIMKVTRPQKETAVVKDIWQKYVGKYRSPWGDMQILIQNGDLVALQPNLPDPVPFMVKLIPVAEHTFRMDAPMGFQAPGELAIFELDDEGNIMRLRTGDNYTYPVSDW